MPSGEASSKGGKKTEATHGKSHMAQIGARGFDATVNRHFGGDRASYLKFLRGRANELGVGGFVDRELQRLLDRGEEVACMEIPIIASPDDDL